MEGFLTFILFTILGIYILGFVLKLLFKLYIRKVQKQFEGFAGDMNSQFQQRGRAQSQQEGDITITQASAPDKKLKGDVGDYVDFEEVK